MSLMSLGTLVAAASLAVSAGVVNPEKTNWLGFVLVYCSMFALVAGVGSIIGFIIRFGLFRRRLETQAVVVSFRQAFLLALLVVAVFYLFANNLFSWLNLIAMAIGFAGLEFFLLSITTKEQ